MNPASKKAGILSFSKITLSILLAIALSICTPLSSIGETAFAATSASLTTENEAVSGDSSTPGNPENPDNPENPNTPSDPTQPENPDTPKEPAATKISGLITEKALLPTSTMTDTIKVSPANGRVVKLQKRLTNGNWKTIQTYTTGTGNSASLKLEYPKTEWKARKFTTWRISIPATATAQAYTSENILLYLKNRVKLAINAKSAIVMNATTGRVLYAKNINTRRPQASITKIMTATLALEKNKLTKKVRISRKAAKTPWTYVPMKTGNKVTVNNLLYAALLPSSNGSATALAETTSGSVTKFVKQMNAKAKELGLTNTHYVNPHGLPASNHYSSAYDTAKLMSYAIKNKTFKKIIGTRKFVFRNASTKKRCTILTTNRLLKQRVKGVIGGKTGTTNAAGCCFTCVYQNNGQTYVTVVLNSKTTNNRFNDTKKLINYAKKYGW